VNLDVLARHPGSHDRRSWETGGAWLYPGDTIVLLTQEDRQALALRIGEGEDTAVRRVRELGDLILRTMIVGTAVLCACLGVLYYWASLLS